MVVLDFIQFKQRDIAASAGILDKYIHFSIALLLIENHMKSLVLIVFSQVYLTFSTNVRFLLLYKEVGL